MFVLFPLGLIGMATTRRPIVLDIDLETKLRNALAKADVKPGAFAAMLNISESQLSQQMARRGGYLSLPRLMLAATDPDGRRVLTYFWMDVAEYLGIRDRDAVAAHLRSMREELSAVLDKVQVRVLERVPLNMAKADLPADAKKRSA